MGSNIKIKKPHIYLSKKKSPYNLSHNYAILFIGASSKNRIWDMQSFAKVGRSIRTRYGFEIVLCGAPSDIDNAKKFKKYFGEDYIDLVSKTTLENLIDVISNCSILISNETSGGHLAIALDKPDVFIIYNGNHFGRFTPYPKCMTDKYNVVFHPEIEKNIEDYKYLSNQYGYRSNLDINEITTEKVINKIDEVLKLKEKGDS